MLLTCNEFLSILMNIGVCQEIKLQKRIFYRSLGIMLHVFVLTTIAETQANSVTLHYMY